MCHVTLVNESCHVWMSHVTLNESCYVWKSHITLVNEWCHVWMSHVTFMNESCHEWMSHVTRMNKEACHTYESGMWRSCMRYATHMNASCHTHKRVMSHIWTSHDAPLLRLMIDTCHTYSINESWHMYKKVISHISKVTSHMWMRHVTRAHAACHTYEWCMSFMWVVHITRVH